MVCQSVCLSAPRSVQVVGVEKSRKIRLASSGPGGPKQYGSLLAESALIASIRRSSAALIVLKLHDPLNVDFWRQDFDKCPAARAVPLFSALGLA